VLLEAGAIRIFENLLPRRLSGVIFVLLTNQVGERAGMSAVMAGLRGTEQPHAAPADVHAYFGPCLPRFGEDQESEIQ
jgi:hypothetical protein